MDKILSISIAAYNVEKYIEQALESIIQSGVIDDIEVFVVDDGGTDKTYQIAQQYQEKYPESIFAVHKTNGGYGSTVNYSISTAHGKYFKLLDGDDWFDSKGLSALVQKLKSIDSDLVITKYYKGYDKDHLVEENYFATTPDRQMEIGDFNPPKSIGMWPMTLKTEVLRKSNVILPEHRLYTDQFYSTIPLSLVETVMYLDINVYCYRTDRNGQSTSKEVRIKHYDDTINNFEAILEFYNGLGNCPSKKLILQRVVAYYRGAINVLLLLPKSQENLQKIIDIEKKMKSNNSIIYKLAGKNGRTGMMISALRLTNYKLYWKKDLFDSFRKN